MDQLIQTFISIISDKYNINTYELKELWERNETNRTIVQEKSSKRSSNGKTEVYNIKNILKHLNNNTDIGKKLIISLQETMNITFKKAECRTKSNRKSHFDFIIIDINDKKYRIEHKGSYLYKKIKDIDTPWKNGVQFVNAGCEKFDITLIYAKLWYDCYIYSNYLSDYYKLSSDIPTFNTWYKGDCCTQGDPKTLFGKELKKVYRNEYVKSSLLHLRKKINNLFLEKIQSDPTILTKFKETVINLGNQCLSEKDIWLQVNGNIDSNISNIDFKWYKNILLGRNYTIETVIKSDIDFYFFSAENNINFSCKLRWGKGCGFSNLRIDFK